MNIINKIIAPTKQHHEKYRTIWVADLEHEKQIWIQNSEDQDKPDWQRYGYLLENEILKYEECIRQTMKNIEDCINP